MGRCQAAAQATREGGPRRNRAQLRPCRRTSAWYRRHTMNDATVISDLVARLREIARYEHADVTVCADAADLIEAYQKALGNVLVGDGEGCARRGHGGDR